MKKIKEEKKATEFDPKTLTDEQISAVFSDERIWKHPRFKELNEKAKRADELLQKEEEAKKKKLEEDKKFEELLEIERKEKEALKEKLASQKVEVAIQMEAVKMGIVDPEVASKLVNRDLIKMTETGEPLGVAEAVKSLAETKPYLIGKNKANLGGPNPSGDQGVKIKLSDIQNADYYAKHKEEVDQAMRTGNVEFDTPYGGNVDPSLSNK